MSFFGRSTHTDAPRARRLGFESLERRDLLTIIRLVDWNTLNRPNDTIDVDNFATILAAIGNETVAGNTKRLDILAVQETDPASPPGNNSIGQIEAMLDGLYPSTDYSSVVSSVDGGGDSTGFIYDTSTLSLLESMEVAPGTLTHKVLRGKFRPDATLGESDFYVYSIHLKSGDTGSDAALRTSEALVLRNDADALGEGANVLFVGDFNMKTSAEGAYTNFVAAGAGQVQDPANAPGNWFNNAAFKHLHTQDPGLSMDDRFDLQLPSGEFFDGVGLEYVDNSFHVFGNNGTHTFDSAITTGTGASPTVLAALAAASDHLPIVADYELLDVTPGVRIVETGGGTTVVEGGLYDTYNIVLNTIPAGNVTVTVTPDAQVDVGNGAGVAKSLVFTSANALTPQTIIVDAANDLLLEGNHAGAIMHTSMSGDLTYDGLTIDGIVVAIVDNDAPTIVINEIDADQTSTDTAEFVELYDGGVGNASLTGMTLVFFNGATDAAYRVIDLAGMFTDGNGYFVAGNSSVSGVDLTFPNDSLQNGADAVALYAGAFSMGAAVTTTNLLDAVVYDTDDADDAGLLVLLESSESQVNENQNSLGTTQSLSRVPDGGTPRRTSTYITQAPTPGAPNQTQISGVLITQSGTRVDVEEGGATDSYQLSLVSIPTADVTITVDPDDQTDLGDGAGVAIVLTFTTADALIPQAVNVAAVDDMAVEGVHTSIITHTAASADAAYNGLAIGSVVANVVDNDAASPTSIVISEIMYNPASDESSPGIAEWIEVVNTGTSTIDLGGWLFDDEDASNWGAIPAGTMLSPDQIAVFFDAGFTSTATFRAEWSIPAGAIVVGITWGSLANAPAAVGDEVLVLLDSSAMQMDAVDYDDGNPWPSVGGGGSSIYLKHVALDNSTGGNWARSTLGSRNAASPTGPAYNTADIGTPGWLPLEGDYNSNGIVDTADYSVWRDTLSSTTDLRADGSGSTAGVPDGFVNALDYDFWKANFGQVLVLGSGGGSGQIAAAVVESSLTIDAALVVLGRGSTGSENAAELKPAIQRSVASSSADLLLIVELWRSTAEHAGDALDATLVHSKSEFDEIDDVFASLDDWDLVAGAAIFKVR
jgi:endonuclease/exonuclease/phosphatase family metal-dependent hydrolase